MHNFWLAEIFLALAALLVASQYWRISRSRFQSPALLIVAAMLCLALAALVGAYRYGVDPGVTELHRNLSRLSGYLTFLLVGLGLWWARLQWSVGLNSRAPAYVTLVVVIASALAAAESANLSSQVVSTLFSTVGVVIWLLLALTELLFGSKLNRQHALIVGAGAVLVLFAGLAVGTDATRVFKVARINWFHLMLAAAALSLLYARPLFKSTSIEHE